MMTPLEFNQRRSAYLRQIKLVEHSIARLTDHSHTVLSEDGLQQLRDYRIKLLGELDELIRNFESVNKRS